MVGTTVPKTVTRVRIHDHSVEHIPEEAFYECTALVEVDLHESLRSIGQWAFGNCRSLLRIKIPSSVIFIDNYAFCRCSALVEVMLHEGLQRIERGAFKTCSSLLCIIIPPSITSIDDYAFSGCWALVQVVLHEGLQRIGEEAFHKCSSLLSIYIPSSVTAIGIQAFTRCNLLWNVTIPSTSAFTQEQFASYFPTLHYKDVTLDLIKTRFDELFLHRLCNNYNPAPGTQAEVQARCEAFMQLFNQIPMQEFQRQDCLGMTPLHVLLCLGRDNGMRVISVHG
jgi:hypothetical protein